VRNPIESRRLSKAERREQLLETARAIVREEGTDALTLAYVAERAGVSKPIAYEHFGLRSGLLIALARQIDDRQSELLQQALQRTPPRLSEVARVASEAYMHCVTAVGGEWQAITAALKGSDEMNAVQRELLERYAHIFQEALAPCTQVSPQELHIRCVAIIGAAEALAQEMLLGRASEETAAATLGSLIQRGLAGP
jgi:AcrR family transcriptional regulator